jgi:glucose-1-phosphate adenylyltransferase
MSNVVTLVLGGGRGSRLFPLTQHRAKPAVPLAGKYRLIDIPLSNCINSGLNHIYVLTQFLSVSLHRHIRRTYSFGAFSGGFVELLAAQQTDDAGEDWYQGTADAVRKNLRYFNQPDIDDVLILSGDQLYRMDYREMIETHRESGADVTIGAMPVSREAASSLGVMRVNENLQVVGFLEKPATAEEIEIVRTEPEWIDAHGTESHGRDCLGSMGIYVFDREFLVEILAKTPLYQDFGKEIFPAAFRTRHVQAHLYDGYWEDIGTIKAFFDANLSLAGQNPPFDFHLPVAPIYTRPRFLPPTSVAGATIRNSLVADGCQIGKGADIENCVIGLRCQIGENVSLRDSILMGADYYEETPPADTPPIGIGGGSVIRGAIVDKNCRIGQNVRIFNEAAIEVSDADPGCLIRDRIPIVTKDAILPNGWAL